MVCEECIKCGNNGADIQYYGHITEVSTKYHVSGEIEVISSTHLLSKEALELTCKKCSYVWVKKPLDVIKREKEQNV